MMPDTAYWPRMVKCLGCEELIDDSRFVDPSARYKNMAELIDLIDTALAAKSRDDWGKIFDDAGLIWGPVMGLHEVTQDSHAQELGMFPKISHPQLGDYTTVNIPMRFSTADVKPKGPSPLLGEHTQQVLENAGLSAGEIADLRGQGVVNDD
jgi:crotonobetainyl-CoA:carnitine CoA-transferase CaiB-like acyl-CoA transferase